MLCLAAVASCLAAVVIFLAWLCIAALNDICMLCMAAIVLCLASLMVCLAAIMLCIADQDGGKAGYYLVHAA